MRTYWSCRIILWILVLVIFGFLGDTVATTPGYDPGAAPGRPTALTAGDFDEDGVADLVWGQTSLAGHTITLRRGNVDAIFPHSSAARQRRLEGTLTDAPFLSSARSFELPVSPDFLVSGDFDNDGHQDLVVAAEGHTSLELLTGDGGGGFSPAERITLPGAVTALVAGEINRRDGLADLVVGVSEMDGFSVLVFEGPEGALRSPAEALPLTTAPTALLLARLTGGPWHDLVVAAGTELFVVRGRDRRLVLGEEQRNAVAPPTVEQIGMPAAVEALAWGDFAWEPTPRRELALLLEDGTIRLLAPMSVMKEAEGESNSTLQWVTMGQRDLPFSVAQGHVPATARPLLLPLRVSGRQTEDLGIFDASDGRAHLLTGMVRGELDAEFLSDPGVLTELEVEQAPVAAQAMRLNPDASSDLVLLRSDLGAPLIVPGAFQATITVDSTADNATVGDAECTLREAINNANADSDTTGGDCVAGSGADTIGFNIVGGGLPATIALLSALPEITAAATIDGTTQGCASPPCIVLDGSGAVVPAGLHIAGGSSSVRGLVLQQFKGINGDPDFNAYGIWLDSSGNLVEGNYIGTDVTGTLARGNEGAGVRIEDGWVDNTVGGTVPEASNVVSAALIGHGFTIRPNADGNHVLGNFIGTDATGQNPLGNVGGSGMAIHGSNNTIGGSSAGARNVISANADSGVYLPDGSGGEGNLVLGNHVGTDVDGTDPLGNGSGFPGIWVGSSNNTIGGTAVGAGNLVSANLSTGVRLTGPGHQVLGNYVGTDVTGTLDLGNSSVGVAIVDGQDNTIGGTTAGARNVISGNDTNGVTTKGETSTGNHVLGNFVGTDVSGTSALGNGVNFPGVWVEGVNNTIGGTSVGARNLVSGNPSTGVYLKGVGHQVLGNYVGTDVTGTLDLGNSSAGVRIVDGQDNTIGGTTAGARNVISGNGSDGVFVGGSASQNNFVLGNFIGTDASGTVDLGNSLAGIEIESGSNNTIGGSSPGAGNVISGNDQIGILIELGATENSVLGNLIGTDVSGSVDLGNTLPGVWIQDASYNTIGGAAIGARNVISGNDSDGIFVIGNSAQQNVVLGNFIGTDASGNFDLGNSFAGVEIQSGSINTIGGSGPGEGNVISGNDLWGVFIELGATENSVLGNLIGTDVSGSFDLGNTLSGVLIDGASDNTIGGTIPGARNVISGNDQEGVLLGTASGNAILGNFIGLQADGISPLGNELAGVLTLEGASNNTIGGTGVTPGRCDGPCNRIGFNAGVTANDGVRIFSGSGNGNAILGNSIHSSAELGIDLEGTGVSPNDPGDTDGGANGVQNFPELSLAEATPAAATVEGMLDSAPNRPFRIEFFASLGCDGSGYGEGARYLGFADTATDMSGIANFSAGLVGPVSDGEAITATATSFSNSTSEFSECFTAVCLSLAAFGQTIGAADASSLSWSVPDDVRFVKGDLVGVGSYSIAATGELVDAVSLDISSDNPASGSGLYYLVRSLACGSWQNSPGADPARDPALP